MSVVMAAAAEAAGGNESADSCTGFCSAVLWAFKAAAANLAASLCFFPAASRHAQLSLYGADATVDSVRSTDCFHL